MSTLIVDMNKCIYVGGIGFVSKTVMVLSAILMSVVLLTSLLYLYAEVQEAEWQSIVAGKISSSNLPHLKTVEDKIVEYIHTVNAKLDTGIAHKLATSVIEASNKYHLPVKLLLGLMTVESGFDQLAISNMGALGFMQVMPRWHFDKITLLTNKNIYDPATNTFVGTQILHECVERTGSIEKGLLCYNGSQSDPNKTYARHVLDKASRISI